jgi:acyl-coenzyme A thioesterase PaaI-like protein
MPVGAAVLTVEFKVNLMAPGKGESILARGRVLKAGRTLLTCVGDVFAEANDEKRHVLTMLATMMTVEGRPGLAD